MRRRSRGEGGAGLGLAPQADEEALGLYGGEAFPHRQPEALPALWVEDRLDVALVQLGGGMARVSAPRPIDVNDAAPAGDHQLHPRPARVNPVTCVYR